MKCLLCNFEPNNLEDVKKHYLEYYNVDQNMSFFVKLSKNQSNVFHGKKCLKCNEFLPSSRLRFESMVRFVSMKLRFLNILTIIIIFF